MITLQQLQEEPGTIIFSVTAIGWRKLDVKKETLKVQAYNIIKEKIVTCQYAPNTLLNEESLKADIDASRTPIRDALSRLEQEGLITILPKKGVLISGLSISDINMIFEVRLLYEPYALRQYGSTIPEGEMLRYYGEMSEMSGPQEQFYEKDDEFHQTIMDAIPNRFLLQTYDSIHTHNLRYRIMTGKVQENRVGETQVEHMAIIKACLSRDWEGAAQAMARHLEASKKATFELLFNNQDGAI